MRWTLATVAGVPEVGVCGTGYTGEDGVELLIPPDGAGAVWDALLERGVVPAGLGARDTLRLEVCFHLYGNDLSLDRNPIEAGPGLVLQARNGLHRLRGAGAASSPSRCWRRSPSPGRASRARATRCHTEAGRGRRHQRHHVAHAWRSASAWPTFPRAAAEPGTEIEVDVRGKARAAEVREQAPVRARRRAEVADASYPEDLKYHPEHDWARIEGDEATFGITWYAQDALGEVVFYDPPEVGATVTKDQAYAEVESVKAVSDVFAPLSGEIIEVNEALADTPEPINADPYGEGWLVKVKLSDPSEVDSLLDVDAYKELLELLSRYTSATDADRRAMLDAIGVGSLEDLFDEIPAAVRLQRPLDLPDGKSESEVFDHLAGLAARNRHADAEVTFLGAGMYDHYVPSIDRLDPRRGRSS